MPPRGGRDWKVTPVSSQSHESLASFRKTSVGSNRKFGLTIGAILIAFSGAPSLLHHRPVRLWLLAPGLVVLVLGFVAPDLLGSLNRLWFRFGLLLGRISNPIVMGILFFVVLAPISWILRLRGHDLLRLRRDAKADSYWIHRDQTAPSTSLTKQF